MHDYARAPALRDYAHAALILLAFALFATENLVHYPVALMALLGLTDMVRRPVYLGAPATRQLLLLFGLVWLPMMAALPDAVDSERSARTVLLYLHFLPAAYYLLRVCAREPVRRMVTGGVAMLVFFVVLDAFAQLIWHSDLFGYPYDGVMLKGVFHPKQRLGLFLAVLAPLALDVARRWSARFPPLWLLLIPYLIVMLMSLKRSAWIMLVVGIAVYWLLGRIGQSRWRVRVSLFAVAAVAAIVLATVASSPALRQQMVRTAGVVSTDGETFDRATSYRLSLWRTGYRIFRDNWFNGIGPRGYRRVYAEYAPPDDFWHARASRGQTHPHLLVLEVAVETGVIGLACLVVFYLVLWWRLVAAARAGEPALWLLCATVAWLPINAHLAFYGSYWSTLAWLMIGIGLARPEPEYARGSVTNGAGAR